MLSAGHDLVFVTNNSYATVETQIAAFASMGIDADGRIVTSSMAAASLLNPGSTAVVGGGPGVVQALDRRGVHVIDPRDAAAMSDGVADAVVVGFHREFNFERLHLLSALVRAGARLIGTNDDATYPTDSGVIPGGGSLLAAVATAGGVAPTVAGKPHPAMVSLVRERLGSRDSADVWMVGDRLSTDGRFAASLGCSFAHVSSAVSESITDVNPALSVASFAEFVDHIVVGSNS